ncbi:sugar phosphate isomerase/epimerase family protein [Enterococcus timonensis]|uniref:sugar phosphate isomerase/epimerase family protein n=1 Tax=Enterococcus timonensis TaxID=1852364 RepID=UPI0008DA8E7A|nr:sugar phosphate isomerase/epimerase [Enterococcus timonensis]
MKSALQLWSIKDEMQKDLAATLEKVSEMGYQAVEFTGYFGHSAKEVKAMLDKFHLSVAGSHLSYELVTEHFDEMLAFEEEIGNKRVIIPWLNFETIPEWENAFATLEEIGAKLAKKNCQLIYHNHGHEFLNFPGIDILDKMARETTQVSFEVDVYWLAFAGKNISAWLVEHQEKVALIHMKDLTEKFGEKESCELGTGILPLKEIAIFAQHKKIPYLVVEQEQFSNRQPLAAAQYNAEIINQLIQEVGK